MRIQKNSLPLQPQNDGTIAQLVEQRTENPCVPSSILGGTTVRKIKFTQIPEFQLNSGIFVLGGGGLWNWRRSLSISI